MPGTWVAAVTATTGSVSTSADVTVTPGAVASIQVSPSTVNVAAGAQQSFSATAQDSCGNTASAPIIWSVTPGAGTINGSGNYTAQCSPVKAGRARGKLVLDIESLGQVRASV